MVNKCEDLVFTNLIMALLLEWMDLSSQFFSKSTGEKPGKGLLYHHQQDFHYQEMLYLTFGTLVHSLFLKR